MSTPRNASTDYSPLPYWRLRPVPSTAGARSTTTAGSTSVTTATASSFHGERIQWGPYCSRPGQSNGLCDLCGLDYHRFALARAQHGRRAVSRADRDAAAPRALGARGSGLEVVAVEDLAQ